MPFTQNEIAVYSATQISVGTSTVIRIMPTAYEYLSTIKIAASAGTLEIVPAQLSGTSTAAGNAWGKGYMFGASEIITLSGCAAIYLAATGATMTAALTIGYTNGATVL